MLEGEKKVSLCRISIKKLLLHLCVSVCVWGAGSGKHGSCGSQRTAHRNQFSPFTIWGSGIKVRGKCHFPLGHITSTFRGLECVKSKIKELEDSISGQDFPLLHRRLLLCSHMWLTEHAGSPPEFPLQGHAPIHWPTTLITSPLTNSCI